MRDTVIGVYTSFIFLVTVFTKISGIVTKQKAGECCNGTLGYVDTPRMPCASLECCDDSFIVAVVPVNHALGYGFRCVPKTKVFSPEGGRCYRAGQIVASTNQTSTLYGERVCCPGAKFHVQYNTGETAIVIRCRKRSRKVH